MCACTCKELCYLQYLQYRVSTYNTCHIIRRTLLLTISSLFPLTLISPVAHLHVYMCVHKCIIYAYLIVKWYHYYPVAHLQMCMHRSAQIPILFTHMITGFVSGGYLIRHFTHMITGFVSGGYLMVRHFTHMITGFVSGGYLMVRHFTHMITGFVSWGYLMVRHFTGPTRRFGVWAVCIHSWHKYVI